RLHIAGEGGLSSAAVLLSVTTSAKRHGLNPWAHLSHDLIELPARPSGADITDLLPDRRASSHRSPAPRPVPSLGPPPPPRPVRAHCRRAPLPPRPGLPMRSAHP